MTQQQFTSQFSVFEKLEQYITLHRKMGTTCQRQNTVANHLILKSGSGKHTIPFLDPCAQIGQDADTVTIMTGFSCHAN